VAGLGEPSRGGWEPIELFALLAELGFDDVEDLDRSAIRTATSACTGLRRPVART
jgi:hypothetical protein